MLGLGLATAILIDATLVRMVLVPATMALLGNANWWLPSWLDRILPRVTIEDPPHNHQPREEAAGAAHRATARVNTSDDEELVSG